MKLTLNSDGVQYKDVTLMPMTIL